MPFCPLHLLLLIIVTLGVAITTALALTLALAFPSALAHVEMGDCSFTTFAITTAAPTMPC